MRQDRWDRRLRRIILTGSRPRLHDTYIYLALETPFDAHASTARTGTDNVSVLPSSDDLVAATKSPALLTRQVLAAKT